ncbi:hypothetical protein [Desulfovibrio legallii]|uniref:Uncharacterized protein n=1 Tax=Desulfovibrio legallii TaxID=571438 RepID=A0A1G7KXN7_9BACT|nr:hypothetical protein [Desulfovibrio legallii]SDF41660.1 hypothetical protein SAMN05192586_10530 [Desulfovibrio legallii]
MRKTDQNGRAEARSAARPGRRRLAWYAGPYKDALLYLMVAIFLVELVVGGVSFFYGVMHAAPEAPGGPPLARFPWLGWAVAAILAPVGLMLLVHLSGTWVARFLGREDAAAPQGEGGAADDADDAQVPERLRRFYAIIRNAPTVVVLLGILLLGAGLFFVDGAFTALVRMGGALVPYIPWIAGSAAALLAVCYLVHRWFIYRHHKMQEEYAYRRQVLERTGIVLVDKGCVPLPQNAEQRLALGAQVVDTQALPQGQGPAGPEAGAQEGARSGADGPVPPATPPGAADEEIVDAELTPPRKP